MRIVLIRHHVKLEFLVEFDLLIIELDVYIPLYLNKILADNGSYCSVHVLSDAFTYDCSSLGHGSLQLPSIAFLLCFNNQ